MSKDAELVVATNAAHFVDGLSVRFAGTSALSNLPIAARATKQHKKGPVMTEEDLKFYRGIAKERDRLKKDCGLLLAIIDGYHEAVGESLDPEDAALVHQIRTDLEAA